MVAALAQAAAELQQEAVQDLLLALEQVQEHMALEQTPTQAIHTIVQAAVMVVERAATI